MPPAGPVQMKNTTGRRAGSQGSNSSADTKRTAVCRGLGHTQIATPNNARIAAKEMTGGSTPIRDTADVGPSAPSEAHPASAVKAVAVTA